MPIHVMTETTSFLRRNAHPNVNIRIVYFLFWIMSFQYVGARVSPQIPILVA